MSSGWPDFLDSLTGRYSSPLTFAFQWWHYNVPLLDRIRQTVPAPGSILEVGTGTGALSVFLAAHGYEVLGIDNDAQVIQRLRQAGKTEVGVPQPALAEIVYGIERLPRSKRRDELLRRFDLVRHELLRAEWTDEVSECFGTIKSALEKKGQRIEDFDAAIAAHALARGAVLVTANVDDMIRVQGLIVEDWSA